MKFLLVRYNCGSVSGRIAGKKLGTHENVGPTPNRSIRNSDGVGLHRTLKGLPSGEGQALTLLPPLYFRRLARYHELNDFRL